MNRWDTLYISYRCQFRTFPIKPSADVKGIRVEIKSHVEGAEQSRLFGRELSYVLPRDGINKFPQLFAAIESDIQNGSLG